MIQRLNFNGVANSLSIGQCSYNILRELYRRNVKVNIFFKYQPDLSAYNVDPKFAAWLEQSANNRFKKLDRKVPTLSVWHLNGSEFKPSDKQYLLTFHETSDVTPSEANICKAQDHTFFTSTYSVDNFKEVGCESVSFVPLGLDEDFKRIEGRQISDSVTHWGLAGGKAEMRKNSELIVRTWIKKYGGDPAHQLTLCVTNPFCNQKGEMEAIYARMFNGQPKPFNVNVLPRLATNAEMNQLYNSIDIDLGGLSSAEGWNIPSHTMTALGKWSIVLNSTAHKDWATKDNSILVEPSGMRLCYDNKFFRQGGEFNQGSFFSVTEDQIIAAMEVAETKCRTLNTEGLKLAEMTYAKTVDGILEKISD